MKSSASVGMHIATEAFFLLTLPTISQADTLHIHIYILLNKLVRTRKPEGNHHSGLFLHCGHDLRRS